MRMGKVFLHGKIAGRIWEDDGGKISFQYDQKFLQSKKAMPISLTLPLRSEAYQSQTMLPFFDGLIPEGWLLDIAMRNWKLNQRDRMGLLLEACGDCIGAVHIENVSDGDLPDEVTRD